MVEHRLYTPFTLTHSGAFLDVFMTCTLTRNPAPIRPDYAPVLGVSAIALCVTGVAFVHFFGSLESDFYARYQEGLAWNTGAPLYQPVPSLNTHPPVVTWLLFGPLARLPYPLAQLVSLSLNLLGLGLSLRIIARTLALSRFQVLWTVALLSASQAMFQHWAMGQFIGMLLYPVTQAWAAYRDGGFVTAGLWLAPAIAMKPPLALLALLLPWPTWMVAGSLSAALSVASVPFTGLSPWVAWLEAGARVSWLALPFNASLWGLAARWQQGSCDWFRMADFTPVSVAFVLVTGAWLAWHAVRQQDRDTRFLCAGLWSVLLSPLGWVYYLPLVLGPLVAQWPGRWGLVAYLLLQVPVGANTPDFSVWAGSLMFLGTLVGWWAWTAPPVAVPLPSHV